MAGYAASARLEGAVPQFTLARTRRSTVQPAGESPSTGELLRDARIDLVGRPFDAIIAERLASIGEGWSQLTFFLFDPESWR